MSLTSFSKFSVLNILKADRIPCFCMDTGAFNTASINCIAFGKDDTKRPKPIASIKSGRINFSTIKYFVKSCPTTFIKLKNIFIVSNGFYEIFFQMSRFIHMALVIVLELGQRYICMYYKGSYAKSRQRDRLLDTKCADIGLSIIYLDKLLGMLHRSSWSKIYAVIWMNIVIGLQRVAVAGTHKLTNTKKKWDFGK
ncbi:unnamed protein product [Leptidea sinapis]|uniref:Uncharacterized protein n=1 Tax=Leptidea sinapis TaxID=189913 RepID=A0A5E4QP45_9NEOP|nr:unnamed protein product [Leptidea sinapis]